MKPLLISGAAAALLSFGLISTANADKHAFNDAESAVDYRQKGFSLIRNNFVAMGEMVKGEVDYDAAIFAQRANDLARLSHIPWQGFIVEGAQPGNDTDALPEIWDNWDDFKERAESFISDTQNLAEAAAGGSMDDIKPAFMAAAKNCKGCHDNYKD